MSFSVIVSACSLVVLFYPVCSSQGQLDCLPWEKEAANTSACECRTDLNRSQECRAGVLYVDVNCCVTYDPPTLYVARCPFIKLQGFDSKSTTIKVPTNLSEISSFFCSPINRKGLLCSQCKKGYGISFLTVDLKCAKCSSSPDSLSSGPVLTSHSSLFAHFCARYLPQMLH